MTVVETLRQAKKGGHVWLLDRMSRSFGDDGQRLVGHGAFFRKRIDADTRTSLVIDGIKYDRQTGTERGKHKVVSNQLYGSIERADFELLVLHRAKIAELTSREENPFRLKRIADILGYTI